MSRAAYRICRDEAHHPPRNRHAGIPGVLRRRSLRRWAPEELLARVREHVEQRGFTAKEILVAELRAPERDVLAALHRLNLEGVITRRTCQALHDSNRDPICGITGWSGWSAGVYELVPPERRKRRKA